MISLCWTSPLNPTNPTRWCWASPPGAWLWCISRSGNTSTESWGGAPPLWIRHGHHRFLRCNPKPRIRRPLLYLSSPSPHLSASKHSYSINTSYDRIGASGSRRNRGVSTKWACRWCRRIRGSSWNRWWRRSVIEGRSINRKTYFRIKELVVMSLNNNRQLRKLRRKLRMKKLRRKKLKRKLSRKKLKRRKLRRRKLRKKLRRKKLRRSN